MIFTYYGTMIYLGQGIKFGWWQWTGVGCIFVGTIFIKIGKV